MIILMRTLLLSRQKLRARVVSYAREPTQINSIGLGNRSGGLLNRTLENYQNIYYSFETVLFIHIFFSSKCKVNYIELIDYWS